MAKTNRASSGFTAVQAGKITPADEPPTPTKSKEPKAPKKGGVTNVISGNASVGITADVIEGGVTIVMTKNEK